MNLLEETINDLTSNEKSESDVLWVGTRTHKTTWEQFKKIANTEYDCGFGSTKVAQDLLIVGNNFWLEREEYDGSEGWVFKSMPIEPKESIELKALTVNQSEELGFDISCGWENLLSINGIR